MNGCKHSGGGGMNEFLNQWMVVSIYVVVGWVIGCINEWLYQWMVVSMNGCKHSGGGGMNEWLCQ